MLNYNRNYSIDALRGISILLVILHHCYIHMPFADNLLWSILMKILFWSGYYGVRIFFVISGFLITINTLIRYGSLQNISVSRFYLMRIA